MISRRKSHEPIIAWRGQAVDVLTPRAWIAYQLTGEPGDDEDVAALRHHRINPKVRDVLIELPSATMLRRYQNSLSGSQGTAGAFTLSEGFLTGWIRAQLAMNPIRNNATIIPVSHGGQWRQPWVDGRAVEGEILRENQPAEAASDVTFGSGIYDTYRFASRSTRVPHSLIEDAPNFDEQIGYVLGDQVALRQNRAYTTGTGVSEPQGLANFANAVTANNTSSIVPLDFAALINGVGDAHADPATSFFMMHKSIFSALLSAQNGSGARLYDYRDGRIMGYRVLLNTAMDSTIASAKRTIIFGNMSRYGIAEAGEVRLQSSQETYAEYNQILFRAIHPTDGHIMQPADNPFAVLVH